MQDQCQQYNKTCPPQPSAQIKMILKYEKLYGVMWHFTFTLDNSPLPPPPPYPLKALTITKNMFIVYTVWKTEAWPWLLIDTERYH